MPRQVTLVIDRQALSGTAACNNYFADARIAGNSFTAGEIGATEMGCVGKRGVAEQRYLEALRAATTIAGTDDRLRMTGDVVDLRFRRVVPPKPAAFEDTRWKLESLVYGAGPAATVSSPEAPAHLIFGADGTLSGTTGCRDLEAQWRRNADTITVSGLPEGSVDCQVGGGQNDHVMEVLSSPFTATIDGRRLTVTQTDGEQLGIDFQAK